MKLDDLTASERFIVEWQYHMLGGFRIALVHAIAKADDGNLERLRKGFPDEVDGFVSYSRVSHWWPNVQEKAGIR